MKKKTNLLIILLTVIIDILAVTFISFMLADLKLGLRDVYVSAYDIEERTLMEESYLRKIKVPGAYISDDVYTLKEDIEGKYTRVSSFIPRGSLIYKSFLESADDMNDASIMSLKEGEICYDLSVRDIDVNPATLIKGMNCSLYFTLSGKDVVSDLLIENARIIGLYDMANKPLVDDRSALNTVSLALKSEMVPYLNKALELGRIKLTVGYNPYGDKETVINLNETILKYLS